MHLDNAFVRYLCVIIFQLFLVIQIMRFFFKNRNSWHYNDIFDCLAIRTRYQVELEDWYQVFGSSHDVNIEYLGRVRKLISIFNLAISLNELYTSLELGILQYILQRIAILITTINYLKMNTSNAIK